MLAFLAFARVLLDLKAYWHIPYMLDLNHGPEMTGIRNILLTILALTLVSASAWAGSSPAYVSERITARLVTAENGVAPGATSISAALEVKLAPGWHTYWKAPGAVGYPVELTWDGSANLDGAELHWPTPKRFSAFDIENYGYSDAVAYPVRLTLSEPGETLVLNAAVNMLVCSDLCVPEMFDLALVLPPGSGIDRDGAAVVAQASAQVPQRILPGDPSIGLEVTAAAFDPASNQLRVDITSDASLGQLAVFPDLGLDAAYGPPMITPTSSTAATVTFEVLSAPDPLPPFEVTVSDGVRAAVFAPTLGSGAGLDLPEAAGPSLAWFFLLAFIGGIILNVMPCVLPVLTIKFASVIKASDQTPARVRTGFLASALGVLAFMWALAAALIAIRAGGGSVGWGIQFQNPYFLTVMATVVTLFAANLFGLFEIALPQSWNTKMAETGAGGSLGGDFAIGALAAVLATPCSAPFLGTAVTFALAGSAGQTLAIFTALGLGLALPYLLVAIWPQSVRALPKPGAWMNSVKYVMGALLLATAFWLIWVLKGVSGMTAAMVILACLTAMIAALILAPKARAGLVAAFAAAALAAPMAIAAPVAPAQSQASDWAAFSPDDIAANVAAGQVVFVDITADWCLSCKANKALVLDRQPVAELLSAEGVTPMQGDWTRPDETILSWLQEHGRYGIPFNIVYGPGAPNGIALPELLTTSAVMDAFAKAGG